MSLTSVQMDAVTAGASSSKSFGFSKNVKSTSSNDANFSGKSTIYDDFTKKCEYQRKIAGKGELGFLAL